MPNELEGYTPPEAQHYQHPPREQVIPHVEDVPDQSLQHPNLESLGSQALQHAHESLVHTAQTAVTKGAETVHGVQESVQQFDKATDEAAFNTGRVLGYEGAKAIHSVAEAGRTLGQEGMRRAERGVERGLEMWRGLQLKERYNNLRSNVVSIAGNARRFMKSLGLQAVGATMTREGRAYVAETAKGQAQEVARRTSEQSKEIWNGVMDKKDRAENWLKQRAETTRDWMQGRIQEYRTHQQNTRFQKELQSLVNSLEGINQQEEYEQGVIESLMTKRAQYVQIREQIEARIQQLEGTLNPKPEPQQHEAAGSSA